MKYNDLDAIYADGPSKKTNERKTVFIFGDNEFVLIAAGVYPKYDTNGRNEIIQIFKSLVYQKDFELNPFELVNFEFDQTITGFNYAMTASNMIAFTEDGMPEEAGDFSTSMNIATMPKMSLEKNKEFIESIIQNVLTPIKQEYSFKFR